MKKTLIICLLAAFTFSLAGNVQAATVTVTSPDGGQPWNKDATQNITWTSDLTATKFDIAITPTTPLKAKYIRKQVSCAAAACTYSWKVGSLVSGSAPANVNYKIIVCKAGTALADTLPADCDDSAAAFTILPPLLGSQQQVFELFKKAIGNRYKDLNAFDRGANTYYTGVAGIWDFIMVNTGTVAAPVYRISTTMVNSAGAYNMSGKALLDWFKGKFITISSVSFLNSRDKAGISYAWINQYKDLCANDFNAAVNNNLKKSYNTKIAAAEGAKKAAISLCNIAYNAFIAANVNIITPVTEPNPLKRSMQQFIKKEEGKLIKEKCISQAYINYYDDFPAVAPAPAVPGVIAARTTLAAGYPATGTAYDTCLTTANADWSWTN